MEAKEALPVHIGQLINAGVKAGMSIGAAGALAAEIYAAGRLDGQFLGAVGPIGVASGRDGMVLLRQDSAVVSIAARDVGRIAREMLSAVGFEGVGIYSSPSGMLCHDVFDGDEPPEPVRSEASRCVSVPVSPELTQGSLFVGVR